MNRPAEKATFGAGCFWGIEAAFNRVKGVLATTVGYMGGHTTDPTYEEVCSGQTGHAEVVEVLFDPAVISYRELLEVFWQIHDPTTLNRQGPDIGSQYRSVIFYHSPSQQEEAQASRQAQQESWIFRHKPIVTAIEPAGTFYRAEEYHQQYLAKR
ncbi:MAG: peptide-methionine (S)-S-oxide reductase MsrA [Desulfuromonadales bacterium]|nr:peptide-methionine (S)-S-oxide reductase MsrA [Desulfuromonadales bacterium]MDW7756770.1 peptide-methionine (S)-S-oxide reductase MsrA [Desulfuromonadales bacterium]